ncbi:FAD-binding and (Fe-S)-binding domain-containing protein [Corynebacterium accolens]|uniref:FAD-binding and (Fe-S)-binding domain-containing protein n=1 Tax=Corynebacterium accolens TaxID=38284 RepID=UPI00266F1E3C|nr:FAD-binding and (Fe-S)-binding domain-containing protein [Corynebacterium accolens]WKS55611.1 FAD-binding oxidoreductase [Corynebacterium accolens]
MTDTTRFNRLDPSVFSRVAKTGLRTDMMTRAAYSSDASIFRRVPAAILEPKTVSDIRDGLEIAKARQWKVVGRGGGTSVAGNAIGEGLIIDTSRYFNRIIEIDAESRTAIVEPGVVADALRDAAAPYGLTYGPDPSTHSRCTIGGMVANNACGSHSVAYGTAADSVVDVTLMLSDGREVTFSEGGCDDPDIDQRLHELVDQNADLIDNELGRFPRQVSGYGLHYLLASNGFNTAKMVAGTEGTIGIITRLTVKLVSVPKHKALAVLAFDSVFEAAAAAAELRKPGVFTIEGMGGDLLNALRSKVGQENAGENLPGIRNGKGAGGWLYCETGEETLSGALSVAEDLLNSVSVVDSTIVHDTKEMRELWKIREASAGVVTRLPDGGEAWPNWEDSAVPPENLADYLRSLYDLMDKYDLRGIPFGHFGEGCVHVRISFDFNSPEGIQKFKSFMNEAAELVSSFDGSLSGEHGDGRARSSLLRYMYSEEMLDLFDQFKKIFDPASFFNPGVLVCADPIDEGIRISTAQRVNEKAPVHKLSQDNSSLVDAVNRCVGVSACRSDSGSMCPSFQITGDEVHSTRGRARLLSEMFRGESISKGFKSKEVNEALDLCLSCKACASECPVNVDMATYKAEFLNKHFQGRIRPRAHYTMGWLPLLGYIAHRLPIIPSLIDRVMSADKLSKVVADLAGLDNKRPLINFAHTSLRSWFKRHQPLDEISACEGLESWSSGQDKKPNGNWETDSWADEERTVVLWPDSFNSNLGTEPAEAAIEVLEMLGYNVQIPSEFVCCGLTWHSTGQLQTSKRVLHQTAKVMKPFVDNHIPVVAIEPSCTTMLQKEAAELVSDPTIQRLAEATYSFSEFVSPRIQALRDVGVVGSVDRSALTQIHCHEQSLGDPEMSEKLLSALGVEQDTIDTGCCGLAGNWGFEKGHAEMSMALGERELFPKVRRAQEDEDIVIADGFSCRTHIKQGTNVRARHIAEVLRDVLKENLN